MKPPLAHLILAVLLSLLGSTRSAGAEGASLADATPQQKREATESYTNGMRKFQKKDFGPAMADFETSYNAVRSPNAILMVARALVELGQLSEGYRRFEQAEAEAREAKKLANKYEATETAAREERLLLETKLGMLTLSVPDAKATDKVLLEGRELVAQDWKAPVPVMPGVVEVAWSNGSRTIKKTVEVAAGGKVAMVLEAPVVQAPPPSKPEPSVVLDTKLTAPPPRTLLYVSAGVGVAGLATFAIFGSMSNSKYDELERACPGKAECAPGLRSQRDAGVRAQGVANVGLMLGIFGATAASFIYLSEGDAKPASKSHALLEKIEVGLDSVRVSGSF